MTLYSQRNAEVGQPLTIGFALDISGSMQSSLQNVAAGSLSRLEGLRGALDAVLAEAQRLVRIMPETEGGENLRFFAYVYGLQNLASLQVCDLFQLVWTTKGITEAKDFVEAKQRLTSDFERRLRSNERQVAMEVMGSEAFSLLSMSRTEAERVIRERIEQIIMERLRGDMVPVIKANATQDLTLTLSELRDEWAVLRTGLSGSSGFVGGNTPMAECVRAVQARFRREQEKVPAGSRFVLLVVSDGESTDGDPRRAAKKIRRQGVQIFSCFVSSGDVGKGKQIYRECNKAWPKGARTMFRMASRVSSRSPEFQYLSDNGWELAVRSGPMRPSNLYSRLFRRDSAVMFAQVNHSAVLEEFLRVVLAPLRAEQRR